MIWPSRLTGPAVFMIAKPPSALKRYAVAFAAFGVALGLTLLARLLFTLNPTPLLLVALIVGAWYGGLIPGLMIAVLSDLSVDWFFDATPYTWDNPAAHVARLLVLTAISLLATSRGKAERCLKMRERQQSAVALFGQEALSSIPVGELLPRAAELVRNTLAVDISVLCEVMPGRQTLCYSAGAQINDGRSGFELDSTTSRSLSEQLIATGGPLVIRDLEGDGRISCGRSLREHKLRSAIAVTVRYDDVGHGVLAAFEQRPREFSQEDITFLRSIANIVAEATARLRAEEEIAEQRTWLQTTLSSIGDGVIATDLSGKVMFMNEVAESLTGWTEDAANGQHLDAIFQIVNEGTRERVVNPVSKVLATRKVVGLANHTVLISRDGREVPIDDSAAPIMDGEQMRGVVLVFADVSERKAAERSNREREIMERLVEAQEAERHRIARDLHDHLGQKMTALRLKVESLSHHDIHGNGREAIAEVQSAAADIDRDIGFLSWELRPTELGQLGLENALGTFVREWSKQHGIPAEFHASVPSDNGAFRRYKDVVETNLYRIMQEALNNVFKHARATQVNVLLQHQGGQLTLIIEDDGAGFDPDAVGNGQGPKGLGLIGMRERAAILKGTLTIEASPGQGTTLITRIPSDEPRAAICGHETHAGLKIA